MTNSFSGRVKQISVSQGGVPKRRVEAARFGHNGIEGDQQNNKRFHGGPERAVCVYSWDKMRALQDEGHPLTPGSIGENLLIEGVDWEQIVPGVRLQVGSSRLEIVSYTKPCFKITGSFRDGDFGRIWQKHFPGWSRVYARVLEEGQVREGDTVAVEAAT